MFNLRFSIENPFWSRFEVIDSRSGSTPFKNKYWELELMKSDDLVAVDLRITTRQDHAGLDLWLGVIGYAVNFKIYDSRHWNNETNSWEIYPGDKELAQ